MTESNRESAPSVEPEKKEAAASVQKPAVKVAPKASPVAGSAPVIEKAASVSAASSSPAAKPVTTAATPATAGAAKPAVAAAKPVPAAAAKPAEAKPLEYLPASIGPGQVVIARDQIYGKAHAIEFDPKKTPVAALMPDGEGVDRRAFISALSVGWFAFSAATAGSLAMMQRFMFPNVLFEPPQSFKAGFPDEYDAGVSERWKEKYGVWIVRDGSNMFALSTVCTHLGCTPNWLAGEGKFKCPCHGSGFRRTGINFEGPAPRPLERYKIVMADDGQIFVDKTRKFQQEKGEWENPESYLRV
ncbi:MAG: ubiquinol-cytochrome c reductase iron-sulfur subunit [Candidatus Hydrogenedentota bacterium]